MVIYRLYAHHCHYFIEALGCNPFENGIRPALLSDAVYNIEALVILVHHFLNHSRIILQIRVNGDRYIRHIHSRNQSCRQRKLMPYISRQLHAPHLTGMLPVLFLNQLPSPVPAAIIYKQNKAVRRDLPLAVQIIKHLPQGLGSYFKHLFFIITGNYDCQSVHVFLSFPVSRISPRSSCGIPPAHRRPRPADPKFSAGSSQRSHL